MPINQYKGKNKSTVVVNATTKMIDTPKYSIADAGQQANLYDKMTKAIIQINPPGF